MVIEQIDETELSARCARHLGSESVETLFSAGNLSRVFGLRLRDGRTVVVKVRRAEPRLVGCWEVQRYLWKAGFPCPQPLAGPLPLAATGYVTGGAPYPATEGSVRAAAFARLLARMITLAPAPNEVSELTPPLAWNPLGPSVSRGVASARRSARRSQPAPGHSVARRTWASGVHTPCHHPLGRARDRALRLGVA